MVNGFFTKAACSGKACVYRTRAGEGVMMAAGSGIGVALPWQGADWVASVTGRRKEDHKGRRFLIDW